MADLTYEQNLHRYRWAPVEATDWLTECVPPRFIHLAGDFHEWPEMAECEASPVDTDIIEGRLHSFGSIEDLIANLKKRPPSS